MLARERLAAGQPAQHPGTVFPDRAGGIMDPNAVSTRFTKSAAEVCAKILAHASIGLFYATYADLLAPAAHDAAAAVAAFVAAEEERVAKAAQGGARAAAGLQNVPTKGRRGAAKRSGREA